MKKPRGAGLFRGAQTSSAQRSYSSASVMRTRTLSPGFSSSLSTNTLPSISGSVGPGAADRALFVDFVDQHFDFLAHLELQASGGNRLL
ncbi:hypothetical protein AM469_000945, partial [Pseudomonas aeruginosa]